MLPLKSPRSTGIPRTGLAAIVQRFTFVMRAVVKGSVAPGLVT